MAHVITRPCCNDASCVTVCPVNCIHPTPGSPDFARAEMLHIDPVACIDCGACVDECPVDAIVPDDLLPLDSSFPQMNADYFRGREVVGSWTPPRQATESGPLPFRVAVIGAGPAAFYTTGELLRHRGVRVDMFDRLPTPYGLVRAGVAPDHAATKGVERTFAATASRDEFRYFLNVEVGVDVTLDELRARYHAVIVATGAAADRSLAVPGEDLAGSLAATDFVAWYNGHPDHADDHIDLSGESVVIVGNGNVALDAARILVTDPDELARTDIADHALHALRHSQVRQVSVLGRRGPAHAAYTNSEFDAFASLSGVDVIVDPADLVLDPQTHRDEQSGSLDPTTATKLRLARRYAARTPTGAGRSVAFRYLSSPTAILGDEHGVSGVRVTRMAYSADETGRVVATGPETTVPASAVIRSIGYRADPFPGLPFDPGAAVIPNDSGRVIDDGSPVVGVYVAGWIKRGARGGIGANRQCGLQTAEAVIADWTQGRLQSPAIGEDDVDALVAERHGHRVDAAGWAAIDDHERSAGRSDGRRRRKLVSVDEMVQVASTAT
ncbi:FAD-dependent oxidoreductase [Dietzia sp. PP-33]|mgnify:CR=1 FL=1|uniref:FAD-dependent oxidoreductase n=1 Tax=Dietzia sp. PP-33 TaxID=2957500 RepID=UPI0029B96C5A|nr:FAD-dependent oxidoreductase [Dietzia sp. PP-33]MDX2356506.1 FAD-dependent oxidoreductase [Dietzia sp. PP-33]